MKVSQNLKDILNLMIITKFDKKVSDNNKENYKNKNMYI